MHCGKPETRTRNIDDQFTCNDCRPNVPQIGAFSIPDASSLAQVNFGDFKTWLKGALQVALQEQLQTHLDKVDADMKVLRDELASTKKDLSAEKNKVTEQKKLIANLQTEVTELKQTVKDTTKYLVNSDRNSRQYNAILFGVPEDKFTLQLEGKEGIEVDDDSTKVKELMNVVGYEGKITHHFRLGQPGDRPRPMKLIFDSPVDSKSALDNSFKLKKIIDQTIFIKPDKTKSENAEFKRVGDKKRELLEKYPTVDDQQPRVVLKKGVLTLDGVEVTRYLPIQSLF